MSFSNAFRDKRATVATPQCFQCSEVSLAVRWRRHNRLSGKGLCLFKKKKNSKWWRQRYTILPDVYNSTPKTKDCCVLVSLNEDLELGTLRSAISIQERFCFSETRFIICKNLFAKAVRKNQHAAINWANCLVEKLALQLWKVSKCDKAYLFFFFLFSAVHSLYAKIEHEEDRSGKQWTVIVIPLHYEHVL